MRLVKPSYEIITEIQGENILKDIELAARTCYKSEAKIEYEDLISDNIAYAAVSDYKAKSARVLIPKLIKNGHHAMLEFGGMITVKFTCDRGVSHELVRHRMSSFAQESTRYCNYSKQDHIEYIIPIWLNYIPELESNSLIELEVLVPERINGVGDREAVDEGFSWVMDMLRNQNGYFNKINNFKWSPQQARAVLANSLKTEINVSANIREWRHIFEQRTASGAHPQMRELMVPLLEDFKSKIPILFDDINTKSNDT